MEGADGQEAVQYTAHKALCEMEDESNVVSVRNFGLENGIQSIPLYALFCLPN